MMSLKWTRRNQCRIDCEPLGLGGSNASDRIHNYTVESEDANSLSVGGRYRVRDWRGSEERRLESIEDRHFHRVESASASSALRNARLCSCGIACALDVLCYYIDRGWCCNDLRSNRYRANETGATLHDLRGRAPIREAILSQFDSVAIARFRYQPANCRGTLSNDRKNLPDESVRGSDSVLERIVRICLAQNRDSTAQPVIVRSESGSRIEGDPAFR